MKKVIRLTESDLRRILKESVKTVLREYTGDSEEYGMYDVYNDLYDMPEDEYRNLQQQRAEWDEEDEDRQLKDYFDSMEADRELMLNDYDGYGWR